MNSMLRWALGSALVLGVVLVLTYSNRAAVLTYLIDARGLSEPYHGVTLDGVLRTGLYPIKRTGADTEQVRLAAQAFLGALEDDQRAVTRYEIDSDEWRRWSNIHLYERQGVGLLQLSPAQKKSAYELLEAGMSERGYAQARDIMRLDTTLGELRGGGSEFEWYGEERFWFTIMGEPHPTDPWGWQIDGHHLVVNAFILGDQMVMSPVFLGAEPVVAESGRHKGVAVLQEEQNQGLAMMLALTPAQQQVATIQAEKTGNNNVGEFNSDNVNVPVQGLNVGSLTDEQIQQFLALVGHFVGNLPDDHARIKMAEIVQHLDETHFSWVGPARSDVAYYYRILSPVVMIEFDHQKPVGLVAEADLPQRHHIHVTIRTPNGNDYGKDLLKQHLAAQHKPSESAEAMRKRIVAQQKKPDRHKYDLPRDAGRKPFETFQFLGVAKGMSVLDVGAYAGYTTEMLAAAVGADGRVFSHNTERVLTRYADGYYEAAMAERLADGRLSNVEMHVAPYEDLGLFAQVDVVWLGNLLHDFYYRDGEARALKQLVSIRKTLRPDGVLGVMDHVGESRFDNQRLHRIEPRTVRRLLRDAGFVVVAESGLFANPEDDHSKMVYDDSIYRRTDRLLYKAMVAD